jgi:hypothetical protein
LDQVGARRDADGEDRHDRRLLSLTHRALSFLHRDRLALVGRGGSGCVSFVATRSMSAAKSSAADAGVPRHITTRRF